MLTDTHCHLDFHKFDSDREAVLQRSVQVGVSRILIPGLTLDSSLSAIRMANSHPILFSAVGVHPTEAGTWLDGTKAEIKKLLRTVKKNENVRPVVAQDDNVNKIVAIGEIGLDYYWDSAPHEVQYRVLKEQLDLAAEASLPVLIHFREKGDTRDGPCAADLLKILETWVNNLRKDNNPLAEKPGVLHSFSGTDETARQSIALNFYLGVGGPVTYRPSRQELIAGLPLERLLTETDAPFLAPAPQRGKRNEPAFISLITDKIALCQSRTVQEVAEVTSANAKRLFSWE
jgi:TatD DNase family protein